MIESDHSTINNDNHTILLVTDSLHVDKVHIIEFVYDKKSNYYTQPFQQQANMN